MELLFVINYRFISLYKIHNNIFTDLFCKHLCNIRRPKAPQLFVLLAFIQNQEAQSQNIPVYVRLELKAEDISRFQLPSGSYMVYEQNDGTLTYIGVGISAIAEGTDNIKLETGKTQDILCTFTIKGYEINRF